MKNEFGFRSVFAKKSLQDMQPSFNGSVESITQQILGRADEFCDFKL